MRELCGHHLFPGIVLENLPMKHLILIAALSMFATGALADSHKKGDDDDDRPRLGFAGLLSKSNREDLPKLVLGSGKALSKAPMVLRSGGYYVLPIESDGTAELALEGPGFFRAVWINEVVVNDLEIRPYGVESLEFDDEGTLEIKFVAIKPGQYYLKIPGSRGDSQKVDITIR